MKATTLYTIKELCQYLGIGRNTALRLIHEKRIHAFKAGRHWLIPEQSIQTYINQELHSS